MARLLLDSHALFWFIDGDVRLAPAAREAIQDTSNAVYVSAVTAWEIASKFRWGKWPGAQALAHDLARIMSAIDFEEWQLSLKHVLPAGELPNQHRVPFDCMLDAQAEI